jgi:hypothetical protein
MVAPIFKWFSGNDLLELDNVNNPLNLGSVDPGLEGSPTQVNLWNNKDGAVDVADMIDVRLTTVTKNGYVSGDSGPTGYEGAYGKYVVEDKYIHAKLLSPAGQEFSPIGGSLTKDVGIIKGAKLIAPDVVTGTPGQSEEGLVGAGTYYYAVSAYDETGETARGTSSAAIVVANPNNQVVLSWDEIDGAVGYKIFRSASSSDFSTNNNYLVGNVVGALTFTDIVATPDTGKPIAATCTYGHKKEISLKPVIPTNAEAGATEFNTRILYKHL